MAADHGAKMTVEDDVRATSADMVEALLSNEASVVAGFMTDDWVHVAATGVTPKADIIGWIASGRLAHHSLTVVSERVVRAGDAVLVTTRRASSGTWDGAPYTADEWVSDIYIQTNGRWRCALSHKTDTLQ
jgi:ketosteroid isomerase-like protein